MPRRDAERNRLKLLDAGREVFAEDPEAPLEEIARRAGVGIGTLYRHFPTRDALVEAIYAEHMDEVLAAAEEAADAENAWTGWSRSSSGCSSSRPGTSRCAVSSSATARRGLAERRRRIQPALARTRRSRPEQGVGS